MTYRSESNAPQLMRIKEVCDMLAISRATIYRWVDEGKFPQPIILGSEDKKRSASRWLLEDVVAWLKDKPRGVQSHDS